MSDLSLTAANVLPGSNAVIDRGRRAGATITAGKPVYVDPTTGKYLLSDNNGTGTRQVHGIALNGASDGQPIAVQTGGDITLSGMTPGDTYCLSATAGGICPQADLTTGNDVVVIGIAKSATVLALHISAPGVTL